MSEVEAFAFTPQQVRRITGLSLSQLRYWDSTGFFEPAFRSDEGDYGGFSRIYSFRDLVGLYTIAQLRKQHRFSLQELRPIGEYLKRFHDTPWSSLTFYHHGKNLYFHDPERPGEYVGARPLGQTPLSSVEMERMARDVRERVLHMRHRDSTDVGQIVKRRNVAHNSWVVAGTRVPSTAVWSLHRAGYTHDQIVREYPRLTIADVEAAIRFEKAQQQRPTKRTG
jgi:uncharacterized protein (DUF433 family)